MTAAHCIDPTFRNAVGFNPIVDSGSVTDGYDVGLLKLERESDVTLPALDTYGAPLGAGDLLMALGWGSTESQQTADTLQMAENLQYVLPARCRQELGDAYKEHMICAGLHTEDTCRGTSLL